MRVILIGGGIIGTTHARELLKAGHEVIHCERDPEAQSASVRNFGLVWVSGRRSGPCPHTPIPAKCDRSRRTVYRFGGPATHPLTSAN